jgi:tRNA pseudouridine55 synthase
VGHAGTLDPTATGLLVMAVGAATRFLQYLPLEPKVYEGQITFGRSSTTYDTEGTLSEPKPIPSDFPNAVAQAAKSFTGLIEQLPPAYSAVKVAGKPLYAYARKGEEAPRNPRNVFVERFEVKPSGPDTASFVVECSGGTYVRTLADDLGRKVGCGAYLSALRRTQAGAFTVEDAIAIDHASPENLIPLADALPPMPLMNLHENEAAAIRQGRRVPHSSIQDQSLVGLLDPEGKVIGVARVDGSELQPECVLPLEVSL